MADGSDREGGGCGGCIVLLAGLIVVYCLLSISMSVKARLDRIDQVLGLEACEVGFLYVDCPLPKPKGTH